MFVTALPNALFIPCQLADNGIAAGMASTSEEKLKSPQPTGSLFSPQVGSGWAASNPAADDAEVV